MRQRVDLCAASHAAVKCDSLLQFRPPLEELRASYYREMRKFVALPTSFQGLGATAAAIFAPMTQRNAASLVQVYRKGEILFARLGQLRDKMRPWVVLGAIDVDAFVDEHVKTVADFEANFRALRERRREAEKLPDFTKVRGIGGNAS